MDKVRRAAEYNQKYERNQIRKLPPGAVLRKPKGEPAVRPNKFFKDEDDFLSIETSLASSTDSDLQESDISDAEGTDFNIINKSIYKRKLTKRLSKSKSLVAQFDPTRSTLFRLS